MLVNCVVHRAWISVLLLQEMEKLNDALETALMSGDVSTQAETELLIAEDHLEHLNIMIARMHFTSALSLSSQLDNTAWVRRAHSGLGQTLLATGLSLHHILSS